MSAAGGSGPFTTAAAGSSRCSIVDAPTSPVLIASWLMMNTELVEGLLPAGAQKYGRVQDIAPDAQGLVHAPEGPGLGTAIDFDLITRRKTAILS